MLTSELSMRNNPIFKDPIRKSLKATALFRVLPMGWLASLPKKNWKDLMAIGGTPVGLSYFMSE